MLPWLSTDVMERNCFDASTRHTSLQPLSGFFLPYLPDQHHKLHLAQGLEHIRQGDPAVGPMVHSENNEMGCQDIKECKGYGHCPPSQNGMPKTKKGWHFKCRQAQNWVFKWNEPVLEMHIRRGEWTSAIGRRGLRMSFCVFAHISL